MPTKSTAVKKTATKKKTSGQKLVNNPEPALREFFIDEIKDIYWAEKKLVTTLPKMQQAVTTDSLKQAIGDHLEATRGHVSRLEQVFDLLGEKAQAKKCDAMEGLVKEGESI